MNCGAEGVLSLLCQVPVGQMMDTDGDPWDPVLVHMTTCRPHLKAVRAWIRTRTPEEPISCSTDFLMRHWGQVVEPIDLPVFGMVDMRRAAGA
jgi:hypothetical protein